MGPGDQVLGAAGQPIERRCWSGKPPRRRMELRIFLSLPIAIWLFPFSRQKIIDKTEVSTMGFMNRSIQWQLIVSMGAALLTSILIGSPVYSPAVDRLAERYLVGEALSANGTAIRNYIERTLTAPITAAAGIVGNTLVQGWLLNGESAEQAETMSRYLEGLRA